MKRLFQLSLDILLISILPIIMWIVLGFTVSKDISNTFSLTYPLQFLFLLSVYIFAIGPNISSKKIRNKNIIYSNMILGTLIALLFILLLIFNVDKYINLMNMNPNIYRNFAIYSIIWSYFNFVMQLIAQKLYYENKNDESNKINLLFNFTNFFSIIISSLLFKNQIFSIAITLTIDFIILSYQYIKHLKRFDKFTLYFKSNLKYTSFGILKNMSMFLTYIIGYGNSFNYGNKYINTINFECLTTDTQWDVLSSIETAASIDITKNKFNYKEHLKNSYKLLAILLSSTLLMNITLYWYYKPNIKILLVILAIQVIDMLLTPMIELRLQYLQIKNKKIRHDVHSAISSIGRVLCSLIPFAFCTYIGQAFEGLYLFIYSKIECRKNKVFKIQ